MAKVTRTVNPLHFEDLEPHRFEDLVRQLAYDFREWRSLEATGRLGADEGIDIRAIEAVSAEPKAEEEDSAYEVNSDPRPDRLWVIQCKREKAIGPKEVRKIVEDAIPKNGSDVRGFILAAACDFSKKARDAFYEECRNRGLQEAYVWGKAELEDKLFQPKNDHLLFAYFGFSLQVRKRTIRTEVRSRLALKKQLVNVLGAIKDHPHSIVLIRDPRETRYPFVEDPKAFAKAPSWMYFQFGGHHPPDNVSFITEKYFAYLSDDKKEWDALLDADQAKPQYPFLYGVDHRLWHNVDKENRYRPFWLNMPEKNQAWLEVLRCIPYERIVAIDNIGDMYNDPPHLLVEPRPDGAIFEPSEYSVVQTATAYGSASLRPKKDNRVKFFPKKIPPASPQPPADPSNPLGA